MANSKISELAEKTELQSLIDFSEQSSVDSSELGENAILLIAKENLSNNKLSFKNFKKNILDSSFQDSGVQTVSSQKNFLDICSLSQIPSVTSLNQSFEENINYSKTQNNQLYFDTGTISLTSEKKIGFSSNNQLNTFFSSEGCLNINTSRNKGSINSSGKTYINRVFIKNKNGEYTQVPLQDLEDENICFKYKLNKNTLSETIFLPKTFKNKPVISVNLHQSSANKYIPYSISNVSEYKFNIRFASKIETEDYFLHISAYAPSILPDLSPNTPSDIRQIQRFHTLVPANTLQKTIYFPFENNTKPSVHVSIENSGDIVPHRISSVMNNSFTITFGSEIKEDFTLHTLSQEIL